MVVGWPGRSVEQGTQHFYVFQIFHLEAPAACTGDHRQLAFSPPGVVCSERHLLLFEEIILLSWPWEKEEGRRKELRYIMSVCFAQMQ
jgi:hypothetical protein